MIRVSFNQLIITWKNNCKKMLYYIICPTVPYIKQIMNDQWKISSPNHIGYFFGGFPYQNKRVALFSISLKELTRKILQWIENDVWKIFLRNFLYFNITKFHLEGICGEQGWFERISHMQNLQHFQLKSHWPKNSNRKWKNVGILLNCW